MSVANLADVKTYLSIKTDQNDYELQAIIDAAEAAITLRVGPLEPTTVTVTLFGGSSALILPVFPALSLTSITPSDTTVLDLADLQLDATAVIRFVVPSAFTSPTYAVVYQAGRTTCPADLLLAVMEYVRYMWQSQRAPSRLSTAQSDTAANSIPGAGHALPFRVEQLLAPHASPRVS